MQGGDLKFKAGSGPHSSSHTILVVDDEEVIRELCSRTLEGNRVLEAENGQQALEILERENVDVVLTDVMMPVMNGLDLLRQIKEKSPNQVVVMMTGFGDKDVILRSLKAGADDFIQKPINLLQLRASIEKVLEKRSLREELVQLKSMDRLKSDFLGLISHKLKTPITVISLFLQNLARDPQEATTPQFRQNLQLILEESQYLADMIQDLLHFSGAILQDDAGEKLPTSLADLIAACLTEAREAVARQGLDIEFQAPKDLPILPLDWKKMRFAFRAVLDNALKFTPPGGHIDIEASVEQGVLKLSVKDDGPGIPAEEQGKIFEKFYQVDPERTGQVRGFGLGLFYARQFVQDLGGTLLLTSVPSQGTTLTFRFPLP